jgi:GT2 family glycosyltransferase
VTPTASVIVPTLVRPAYLAVALAPVRPQTDALGAELIVVDDGGTDATRAVAEAYGARYLRHDRPSGLNAARNTGIAAAGADLLVFLDDDVAVRPGWLAALLHAHATEPADVGAFAGPIHARIEDHRYPQCGREYGPVTELDLGPDDRDTDFAWGANMTIRRATLDAVGPFDESLELYGDEQDFQRRFPAAGLRVRYVAAAALDHRRAGEDARLHDLMGAAYRRGGASRRQDVAKGTAPPLAAEVRTLLACALHGPRRRCFNGPVMAAHSTGRLRAALARPTPAPAVPGESDFTSGVSGTVAGRRGQLRGLVDRTLDVRQQLDPRWRAARRRAASGPRRRIHVIGVERPGREMDAIRAELARSRHDVTVSTSAVDGRGKFENLNRLLADGPPDADWLLVVDDDVVLPPGFLDLFVDLAERTGLRLAQPAHRLHSNASWPVTRRVPGRLVRQTSFVEIGPITLLHPDTFGVLVPFPELRMGWGLDAHWGAVARERGWPIGVVDATPILHLQPSGSGYDRASTLAESRAFLADRPYVRRDEVATLRKLA